MAKLACHGSHPAGVCAYISALCFFVSASIYLAGAVTQTSAGGGGNFQSYMHLNTTTLQAVWAQRRAAQGQYLAAEIFGAVGWFSVLPAIETLAALTGGHSAASILKWSFVSAAMLTLLDFTFQAGLVQMTDWISRWPFFMADKTDHPEPGIDQDHLGPMQVLEVSYLVSTSRTIWLFAIDELLLSVGFLMAALLVAGGKFRTREPFSMWWGVLSALGALLAFVGFILNCLRVLQWRAFATASGVLGLVYSGLLFPVWIIWLGAQLKSRSSEVPNEQRNTDTRGEVSATPGLTPYNSDARARTGTTPVGGQSAAFASGGTEMSFRSSAGTVDDAGHVNAVDVDMKV